MKKKLPKGLSNLNAACKSKYLQFTSTSQEQHLIVNCIYTWPSRVCTLFCERQELFQNCCWIRTRHQSLRRHWGENLNLLPPPTATKGPVNKAINVARATDFSADLKPLLDGLLTGRRSAIKALNLGLGVKRHRLRSTASLIDWAI